MVGVDALVRRTALGRTRSIGSALLFGLAAITAIAVPAYVHAQSSKSGASKPAPKPKTAGASSSKKLITPADSDAAERAFREADEKRYYDWVMRDRAMYLKRAAWAELGDRCNPGDLRVFPRETSTEQQDSLQRIVEHMESTVIGRGVGSKLDTPEARALLRVIVGWEAGIDRPRWDSDDKKLRMAVATGLTGEVPDPRSDKCLPSPLLTDTVTFVVPGFTSMDFPKAPTPRVKAYFGPQGQQHARDEFFAAYGRANPEAELTYIVVAPMVIWRGWALVAVDRPREKGGVEIGVASNGGATYLLRRVGTEWRLLSIVRSWGS